ncbi:unnamed protein product [Microthlaspi erraticum]|uniref:Uncharacterized protein n=1 Tax=Microthlaspi erraticum TaxID=1685480 RepID=A0A6D2IQP0_9BRAS|nr:unnamed protein product [Microthlaspi erraticum]
MVVNGVSPEEGALLTKDISDVLLNTVPKKKKVMVSEQVSAMIQNKIPEKLPDPGNFVLDCSSQQAVRRRSTIDGQSFSVEISKDEDAIKESIHMTLLLGKRSVPPKLTSHPAAIPHFLGRPHAPNAYTPPWMRRHSSQRHLLPLSDPPDA